MHSATGSPEELTSSIAPSEPMRSAIGSPPEELTSSIAPSEPMRCAIGSPEELMCSVSRNESGHSAIGSPPALKSQELNCRFLSPIHFLLSFSIIRRSSFQLSLICQSVHLVCFSYSPLQPVSPPEVGMRLPARRLSGHICKNLTSMVSPEVLVGKHR